MAACARRSASERGGECEADLHIAHAGGADIDCDPAAFGARGNCLRALEDLTAAGEACLSSAQADAIRKVYNGPHDSTTGAPLAYGYADTVGTEVPALRSGAPPDAMGQQFWGGVGPSWLMGNGVSHDSQHDVVLALSHWVEDGVAPDQIIATEFDGPVSDPLNGPPAGTPIRSQRPICAYPKTAQYTDHGSTTAAESFRCGS